MEVRTPLPTPVAAERAGLASALVRLARPKQWAKNVLVFAAPGAAGVLTEWSALADTLIAFVAFCFAASGTYYLNDAFDAESDRLHPEKARRPVASGAVSPRAAKIGGVALCALAIGVSFAARWELAAVVGGYLVLTTAYSARLKHEPVLDLAAVAAGFVLRAIAGGAATGVPISPWFLIVAAAAAVFMVAGKRHAELVGLGTAADDHRSALGSYSTGYLGYVRSVASSVAVLAYCLWAFEKSAPTGNPIWFELSIVPFVLGILRYALLVEQGRGSAPEELVLGDRTLLAIGALWAVLFGIAVYAA